MASVRRKLTVPLATLTASLAATVPSPAAASDSAGSCTISGKPTLGPRVEIYDESTGGEAVAKFTGAAIEVTATRFPSSASGRAHVRTSGFRIDGYASVEQLPVHTRRAIPVRPAHVWIAAHQEVTLGGARGSTIEVEKQISYPIDQTFTARAPCGALTLTERVPQAHEPDGHARGYVLEKSTLDLFAGPSGSDGILELQRSARAPGVLFFSTKATDGWVHLEHHGAVVIDAWARAGDIRALPPGETMDQLRPSSVAKKGQPKLKLQGDPRVVKATRPVAIRGRASDSAGTIGRIEPETVVYVLHTVAGWASVMPQDLAIAPAGERQFWVKSSELET